MISKYAGLGSIIQSTPLIQTLRINYPKSQLIFVTTESNSLLLKHIPEIDTVLLVSDKNIFSTLFSSLTVLNKLWHLKPELFIDLEFYSNYSGIMTTLSKATNRLGFYNEDKAYRKGIHNYLLPFNIHSPISKTYLQFAGLLKCKIIVTDLKIESDLTIKQKLVEEKTGISIDQKYIVINPNASDLRVERRWPKESFAVILNTLLEEQPDLQLILIGNAAEKDYVNELAALLRPSKNLINTAGKLNLSELIFLLKHAALMLTNDTGPMHMAFALHTKTIALFGPCSPDQYGAKTNGIAFYKNVSCSPCVHKYILPPCKGNNICMKNIGTEEVQEALKSQLA